MPHTKSHPPGAFCWIELATSDQTAAKTFYASLFGWNVVDSPIGPSEVYSIFKFQDVDSGAAYTMREDEKAMGIPSHWTLYMSAANADESAAHAAELGAKILVPAFDVMDHGRMAVIQDLTGAVFCVWQAKQHTGLGIAGEAGTFCWADLSTPDVDKAKEFYECLFGWKIFAGEKDTSGYLHIENGSTMIGGIPPAKYRNPNVPPHWMIYFMVSDCDESAAKLKELGGAVYMGPSTMEGVGRFAIVADPQGAVFALFQPA